MMDSMYPSNWLGETYKSSAGASWSLKVATDAPQSLWFLVWDSEGNYYLTPTAVDTSQPVNLNLASMTRLE
jgi:hypothetical protein